MKIPYVLLFTATLSLVQCKARISSIKAVGGCSINPEPTVEDSLSKAVKSHCNPDFDAMMVSAGCQALGRALVGEGGHMIKVTPRKIDVYECQEGLKVWLASPDEIITTVAEENGPSTHQFYKGRDGQFKFMGDSFSQHECKKCHVMGELNIKEMPDPWENWAAEIGNGKHLIEQEEFLEGKAMFNAATVETEAFFSHQDVARAFAERVKVGREPFANASIKQVLKSLFCDTKVQLGSFVNDGNAQLEPGLILHTKLQRHFSGTFPVSMAGWLEVFKKRGISVPFAEKTSDPDKMRIGFFPGTSPRRSNLDDEIANKLLDAGMIDNKLVIAAYMVDYPNAVFSKRRCAVWNFLPEDRFRDVASPAQLRDRLTATLKSRSEPEAKEFLKNLTEVANVNFNDQEEKDEYLLKTTFPFTEQCRNNPRSVINNLDDLYLLMRAKTVKAASFPILEKFTLTMFPEHEKFQSPELKAEAENFRLDENCELDRGGITPSP
ncbi:MAG: hypothetical protein AB7T49_19230 [Oligoflexales bacterium]